jgi:glycosyltransferase involved in cell wall biosynthesis
MRRIQVADSDASCVVSVLIAAYNVQDYVRQSIQSVIDQTFGEFELIVVNDGSTDETDAIVRTFDDPRLTYIVQDNQGLSSALNTARSEARGRYLALLDADDVAYPERLERQIDHLFRSRGKAVFSWLDVLNDEGTVIERPDITSWFNVPSMPQAELLNAFFNRGNVLAAPSAVIDREVLDQVGGYCVTVSQVDDFDLWAKLVKHIQLDILPIKLVGYRVRDNLTNLTYATANTGRLRFESRLVYRTMFDDVPESMFREAFHTQLRSRAFSGPFEYELEKAFLYLSHPLSDVRTVGMEKLYTLLQDPAILEVATAKYDFHLKDFFAITQTAGSDEPQALRRQEEWTKELAEAVQWHSEQSKIWAGIADERDKVIASLQQWSQEQAEAVKWQEEQRKIWEDIAEEHNRELVSLKAELASFQAQLGQLQQRRGWFPRKRQGQRYADTP